MNPSASQSTLYLLDTNILSHVMRNPTGAVAQRVFAEEAQNAFKEVCTRLINAEFSRVPGLSVKNWLQPS